jgi:hypothetical protein
MKNASVDWNMYSDAIQRHSIGLSQSIVTEVSSKNVMQFGERLIHPIAWKHSNQNKHNSGWCGKKRTSSQSIEGLLNTASTPLTFILNEELARDSKVSRDD